MKLKIKAQFCGAAQARQEVTPYSTACFFRHHADAIESVIHPMSLKLFLLAHRSHWLTRRCSNLLHSELDRLSEEQTQ